MPRGRPKGSKNRTPSKIEVEGAPSDADTDVSESRARYVNEAEPVPSTEPAKRLPPVRPYKKKTIDDLPRAVPSGTVLNTATAMAKVTTSKYIIDRWCALTKGKPFTGPRRIIGILRQAGLVE